MSDELDGMDEILSEFLVESYENLDSLDSDLIVLEGAPESTEILGKVFRTIHSIKGTSGVLGFEKLERVTHVGENLLSRMRDGILTFDQDIATALLQLVDAVRQMLGCIETEGADGDQDFGALIALLEQLLEQDAVPTPAGVQADVTPAEVSEPDPEPAPGPSEEVARSGAPNAERTVRVHVKLLDQLMNQVGELVLARNRILQCGSRHENPVLQSTIQELNLITTELQEEVMKTRMQPIGSIWNKFPRAIRDLCVSFEKKVDLVMEGRETELDRTLIEAIKAPLTHAIRNSVDHGIETPERRLLAGKPATGTVRLCAYHEGGMVAIELWDDGAGVDPQRVAAKAIEKGILTSDEAARLGQRDLLNLVFAPGFSMASKVTNVSGRGVGMDVVRTNIEGIGGTVELKSEVGKWTELKFNIPLTLAIIPALMVHHHGGRYAIPQASLVELLRLDGSQAGGAIERVHGARVCRLRGKLLPLLNLGEVLGLDGPFWPDEDDTRRTWNVVVLRCDGQSFGLLVDSINDTEEIVVKPLGKQLKEIPVFAGATIMGDGNVALILDVLGVAKSGSVLSTGIERRDTSGSGHQEVAAPTGTTLILVEIRAGERVAIPLSSVNRLEDFPSASVERSGQREVIQYRGLVLPLVRLDGGSEAGAKPEAGGHLQVIVKGEGAEQVGIVVDRIIDILEAPVNLELEDAPRSIVLDGRVTELLDTTQIQARAGHEEAAR
ncbi:MAG: chemotaxis protein CheA [Planctomycetota bacterium]|nr:chemotaxis protein CheA [Planctomycetota bacterium]